MREKREEVLIWARRKCWVGIGDGVGGDEIAGAGAAMVDGGDTEEKNFCCDVSALMGCSRVLSCGEWDGAGESGCRGG